MGYIDDGVSGQFSFLRHHGRESYPTYAGRFAMQIIPEGVTYDNYHVVSISVHYYFECDRKQRPSQMLGCKKKKNCLGRGRKKMLQKTSSP